ncbi:hypothetical protein, partial [Reichenbachiella sp.]|uniref:hypothetical protein n=1 Tax=Reichenbachiella sp. TaxID=2184521 RepID=UPI0032991E79
KNQHLGAQKRNFLASQVSGRLKKKFSGFPYRWKSKKEISRSNQYLASQARNFSTYPYYKLVLR